MAGWSVLEGSSSGTGSIDRRNDNEGQDLDLPDVPRASSSKKKHLNGKKSESDVEGEGTQDEGAAALLDSRRQSQLQKQSRLTKAHVIIPPENFAIVEDGLYRSGQPSSMNYPFLQRLHLRTLLWLAPEPPESEFCSFLDEQSISLQHLGFPQASNAWDPVAEEIVLKSLELLLRPEIYPLMVMCNLGRHRTGTVIGCLRKLQRWNLASIFEEYRRHAGSRVRLANEQFIELFDTDLVSIPLPAKAKEETESGVSDDLSGSST